MNRYIALLGYRRGTAIRAEVIRAETFEIAKFMAKYQISTMPNGKILAVKEVRPLCQPSQS